jgi:hypothetical protein
VDLSESEKSPRKPAHLRELAPYLRHDFAIRLHDLAPDLGEIVTFWGGLSGEMRHALLGIVRAARRRPYDGLDPGE